jgi:hypothetical protein
VRTIAGAPLIVDESEDAQRAYPRSAAVRRVHERATQYAPVMGSTAFFWGITAVALWDAPVPPGVLTFASADDASSDHRTFDPDILDVCVLWPNHAPRGAGVRGHALRPGFAWAVEHPTSGLRIASPASTWAGLPRYLSHPYDLVAVADFFVRIQRPPHSRPWETVAEPLTTVNQLQKALDAGRRYGIGQLKAALARVRTGAASRTETWTRLSLVDGGLPEPILDHDVFDHDRRFIATVDMAYPQWKIAIEYEGAHHGDGDQWERDIERIARLEAAGWRVIRVTRTLLFREPRALVARVRTAITERNR